MHPGIPLPFKQNATTRLVTDKEVAVIEKIVTRLPQPLVQYFVPYVGYYSYAVINMIKEISQAATALPETGPSKIGK